MKKIFIILLFSICSIAQNQSRNQNIVAAEYFLNIDPGEGKGIPLSATYGFALAEVSFIAVINNDDVIYIRFKSSNGKWNPARSFKYKLPLTLRGAIAQVGERFINSDPGYGKATGFTLGDNGIINSSPFKILRNDKIFIRVKDNLGRWGEAASVKYRYKDLIEAQYSIKFKGGNTTGWLKIPIQSQTIASAFYSVQTSIIGYDKSTLDSLFIEFQSEDFVWGIQTKLKIDYSEIKEINDIIPTEFSLSQNYPNPFNPSTKIKFDVAKQTRVKLTVFDVLGREIKKLADKEMNIGSYEIEFNGNGLPSGVYFYRIETSEFVSTNKMILLR